MPSYLSLDMAQVKDLYAKQGNVDITLEITELGDAREFQKFGKPGRVATAIGKDASGTVKITLWNEQIDQVKVGDTVDIKNGYVSEWQGENQVSTGRNGTLTVKTSAAAPQQASNDVEEETIE